MPPASTSSPLPTQRVRFCCAPRPVHPRANSAEQCPAKCTAARRSRNAPRFASPSFLLPAPLPFRCDVSWHAFLLDLRGPLSLMGQVTKPACAGQTAGSSADIVLKWTDGGRRQNLQHYRLVSNGKGQVSRLRLRRAKRNPGGGARWVGACGGVCAG